MIKRLILLLAVMILLATPAQAEDMYIGVGGSYAIENFGTAVGYDNTSGISLKAGYVVNENVAVELNYDYLPGFKYSGEVISADADVETLMIAGKITTGENIKPYLIGGLGLMRGDLTASTGQSASESDLCMKSGVGVDCFVSDDVSIGLESSYVMGLGDLDVVEYTQITCGANYYF